MLLPIYSDIVLVSRRVVRTSSGLSAIFRALVQIFRALVKIFRDHVQTFRGLLKISRKVLTVYSAVSAGWNSVGRIHFLPIPFRHTVFKTDDERTYFVAILNIHPEAIDGLGEEEHLTEQEINILEFCRETPRKRKEISEYIGLTNRSDNFKKHVMALIRGQYLTMIMPENPNSPKQRYVITAAGREAIHSLS